MRAVVTAAVLLLSCLSLTGCERSGGRHSPARSDTATPTGIGFLAADGLAEDFARAVSPKKFQFPADHGAHPEYQTEWWYFTGNLTSSTGRHYGFEFTIFRYALSPRPPESGSAWSTNQVYMAHLAVTDTARRELVADERLTRAALGLAGAEIDPLAIWIEDWRLDAGADGGIGMFELDAHGERVGLTLSLEGLKPPVSHGESGLDPKGPEPGNASYYYSLTRMKAAGTITIEGRTEPVEGLAWMDREWSTSVLSPDIEGWDWFALQLSDGRDLMLYRLRGLDGSTSRFSGGSLVGLNGERTPLGPDDFALHPLATWQSARSRTRYPVAWRVSLPSLDLDLEVRPVLDDQEILLSVRYWEGAVTVSGQDDGRPIAGAGYVELAGYR